MRKINLMIIFVVAFNLLGSCEKQETLYDINELNYSQENYKKVNVMKEFSKLLGTTLLLKENREYLVEMINERNDNSEAITVNALLGKNIPTKEKELLNNNKKIKKTIFKNTLKNVIIYEIENNLSTYPMLAKEMEKLKVKKKQSRTNDDIYDELSDFFIEQGLDVYFPYEENFNLAKEKKITVTWDPMTNQETNTGFFIDINENESIRNDLKNSFTPNELIRVDNITDDYAYENATLVVRPATWIGSSIFIDPNPNPTTTNSNPPNWALQGWQGFLTFNVDHTKIKEEDILKVNIPKIRLMEHLATFLTPTTITLIRSSSNLTTDNNNLLVFPLSADSRQLLTRHHIKRKNARNKNWVDVNVLWDDDWNMHEAEHTLTWASHHTFSGSLTASGTVKLGWDEDKKKVTFDPKIDINFNVKVGSNCRLRYNNNVSRRAILSQVIGDTGAGTYNDNGINYSIRTADKMQYYFKPYLTKLSQ